jgi:hypothetical protein
MRRRPAQVFTAFRCSGVFASQPGFHAAREKFDVGSLIVQAGNLDDTLASRREKRLPARDGDFFERLQAIAYERRAHDEQPLHTGDR